MDYLFDDVFLVKEVDPDGKKFDRVSRVRCESENYEMDLSLDVASEIYSLRSGERFHCVLSPTLSASSSTSSSSNSASLEEGYYDPEMSLPPSNRTRLGANLADKFDYVMHGKVYKAEEAGTNKVGVYMSFGGLLMRLQGDPRHWRSLTVGSSLYILIKKM